MATDDVTSVYKTKLMDGRALTRCMLDGTKAKVEKIKKAAGITLTLATVLVGNDPASVTYTRMKRKRCVEAGMTPQRIELPATPRGSSSSSRGEAFATRQALELPVVLLQIPVLGRFGLFLLQDRHHNEGGHPPIREFRGMSGACPGAQVFRCLAKRYGHPDQCLQARALPGDVAADAAKACMEDAKRRHVLRDHEDGLPYTNCPVCKRLTKKKRRKSAESCDKQ